MTLWIVGMALFLLWLAMVTCFSRRSPFPLGAWMLISGTVYGVVISHSWMPEWLPPPLDSYLILEVILPALLLAGVRTLSIHNLKAVGGAALWLATGGLILAAAFMTVGLRFGFQLPWVYAALLGIALSSTDPGAIVALLERGPTSGRMKTLVETESVLNDGTSITLFTLLIAGGVASDMLVETSIPLFMLRQTLGGLLAGGLFGILAAALTHLFDKNERNDAGILIPLGMAYLTAQLSEHHFGVSPLIAVFAAAVLFHNFRCQASAACIEKESERESWRLLETLAISFLFFGLGNTIGTHVWNLSLLAVLGLALLMTASRSFSLLTTHKVFSLVKHPLFTRPDLPVLHLAGMKGAITAALLMSLPGTDPWRNLFLCAAYAMILFTFILHPLLAAWLIPTQSVAIT